MNGNHRIQKVFLVVAGLLLLLHAGFAGLKVAQALTSASQRQPWLAGSFVARHIPPGSRVVGDALFYYAVVQNGSEFQYVDAYNSLPERERRQRLNFDFDYLLVSEISAGRDPEILPYYLSKANYDTVAVFQQPEPAFVARLYQFGLLSQMERSGYNAVLLRRRK